VPNAFGFQSRDFKLANGPRGKGNVVPVLLFNCVSRHEGVLGSGGIAPFILLTSALAGVEWSASRPGRFNRRERAPSTHWIGGWVGPRADLKAVVFFILFSKDSYQFRKFAVISVSGIFGLFQPF
jgi:hypothetical protein